MGHQNGQADDIPNIRYFRCGMGIANGSADFNAGRAVALQLGIGIVAQAAVTDIALEAGVLCLCCFQRQFV